MTPTVVVGGDAVRAIRIRGRRSRAPKSYAIAGVIIKRSALDEGVTHHPIEAIAAVRIRARFRRIGKAVVMTGQIEKFVIEAAPANGMTGGILNFDVLKPNMVDGAAFRAHGDRIFAREPGSGHRQTGPIDDQIGKNHILRGPRS